MPFPKRNVQWLMILAALLAAGACQQAPRQPVASLTVIAEQGAWDRLVDVRAYRIAVHDTGPVHVTLADSADRSISPDPTFAILKLPTANTIDIQLSPGLRLFGTIEQAKQRSVGLPPETTLTMGRELVLRTTTLGEGLTYRIQLDSTPLPVSNAVQRATYAIADITEALGIRNRPYTQSLPRNRRWGWTERFFVYDSTAGWRTSGHSVKYDRTGRTWSEVWIDRDADTGREVFYWPNGKLNKEVLMNIGTRIERNRRFDITGKLVGDVLINYRDRRLPIEGVDVEFWGNGQMKSRTEYRDTVLHGAHKYWHYDGSFGGESHFENGNGIMKQHYADGTPMIEHPYVDGTLHGVVKEWYPNGQQSILAHYDHGVLVGEYFNWHADGTTYRKARFDHGRAFADSLFRDGKYVDRWHP